MNYKTTVINKCTLFPASYIPFDEREKHISNTNSLNKNDFAEQFLKKQAT